MAVKDKVLDYIKKQPYSGNEDIAEGLGLRIQNVSRAAHLLEDAGVIQLAEDEGSFTGRHKQGCAWGGGGDKIGWIVKLMLEYDPSIPAGRWRKVDSTT